MASKGGLTIQIDANLIEAADKYAHEHNTTLQELIAEFIKRLATAQPEASALKILDRLTGILPQEASTSEHGEALAKKYLDDE